MLLDVHCHTDGPLVACVDGHVQSMRWLVALRRAHPSRVITQLRAMAGRVDAARALPIRLLYVARAPTHGVEAMATELERKLSRFVAYERVQVKPQRTVDMEDAKLCKLVRPKEYVMLFDPRGKAHTSESFAKLLVDASDGHDKVVACVGGAFGVGEQLRARADAVVQLSPMVMSHEVARLVALEQLYRAWTILRGENYHHG